MLVSKCSTTNVKWNIFTDRHRNEAVQVAKKTYHFLYQLSYYVLAICSGFDN